MERIAQRALLSFNEVKRLYQIDKATQFKVKITDTRTAAYDWTLATIFRITETSIFFTVEGIVEKIGIKSEGIASKVNLAEKTETAPAEQELTANRENV